MVLNNFRIYANIRRRNTRDITRVIRTSISILPKERNITNNSRMAVLTNLTMPTFLASTIRITFRLSSRKEGPVNSSLLHNINHVNTKRSRAIFSNRLTFGEKRGQSHPNNRIVLTKTSSKAISVGPSNFASNSNLILRIGIPVGIGNRRFSTTGANGGRSRNDISRKVIFYNLYSRNSFFQHRNTINPLYALEQLSITNKITKSNTVITNEFGGKASRKYMFLSMKYERIKGNIMNNLSIKDNR